MPPKNPMMSRFSEPPGAAGEILLFGCRVKVDPIRKCASMNNLSELIPVANADSVNKDDEDFPKADAVEDVVASGYASADEAALLPGNGSRERKRGVPWTEEEHKLFLYGLQKVGKGNWRTISRDYVKTRTPTQVASHAQKYFFRRSNNNRRRRRRSSVFDITTDSLGAMSIEQAGNQQDNRIQRPTSPIAPNIAGYPIVGPVLYPIQEGTALGHPVYILPSSTTVDLEQLQIQPPPLSSVLSLASSHRDPYTRQILA